MCNENLNIVTSYLISTAVVGFYGLPYLSQLQPSLGDTSMGKVMFNCSVLLILSSALPVVSKMLGKMKENLPVCAYACISENGYMQYFQ